MAKSKRCLRRVMKLSVFLICTAGFLYYTWSSLQLYLTYPTMQDVSEEQLDSFSLPAITICNRNRFSRLLFCATYPKYCSWQHTTWETFCATYRKQCPEITPPGFHFGIPEYEHLNYWDIHQGFLKAFGQEKSLGFIISCNLYEGGRKQKCNSSIVIQVPHLGSPYNCLSIFSLLGKQNDKSLKVTYNHIYKIYMDLHPEEYLNPEATVQASVAIHDPRKLVNPMTEGVTLSAGDAYMLYPSLEMRKSLPPPYASQCIDYLNEWKKNGGHGPLSKKDCIDVCKIKAMIEEHGCMLRSVTYPNNYTLCEFKRIYTVSSEVHRRCSSICQDACKERIYHLISERYKDLQASCNSTDEHCKNSFLGIYVNFDRMKIKKFQQIPRFESIELFGYIGGYLGICLGISLASVFDFAEIIYNIVYPFQKRKRKQNMITPIVICLYQTV